MAVLIGFIGVIVISQPGFKEMNYLALKLKQVKEKIRHVGKKVKIIYVKDRPGHDLRYAIDSKKIRTNLKWKPLTNLNNGISKTIDWYINNTEYFKSISNKKHLVRLGTKI